MRRSLPVAVVLLAWAGIASARGLLIPDDKTLPPLAMLNHKVTIAIEDQVAVTHVEQTFRNHTDRPLEATYVFPVPKGASVNKFTMWVDGKEVNGELVEAAKARRSTPASSAAPRIPACWSTSATTSLQLQGLPDPGPRRPEGGPELHQRRRRRERQPGRVRLSAQDRRQGHRHAGRVLHHGDHQVAARRQQRLQPDARHHPQAHQRQRSDGHLRQATRGCSTRTSSSSTRLGDKDIGLTALTHRPVSTENGYFTHADHAQGGALPKEYQVPRDMVLVLDTSGSMRGVKMEQARKALKYCLQQPRPQGPLRPDQLRHHGQPATATACSTPPRSRSATPRSGSRTWKPPAAPPSTTPWPPPWPTAATTRAGRSPSSSSPTASRPSARPTPTRS